ncbi:ribonuclease P protein component [Pedobacter sp. UYP30]|uniref:ribonuclease P protein component n=1 Tax=Pedobacter sp. UYP30 TaxID=1756400 RepID=UPI0033917022
MYTFKKEERLCSKKHLDLLFKGGSSFLLYPFRISYLFVTVPNLPPVQVVISVPKKRFKRAVDRNLIKRRIREAYRLNKETHLCPNLPDSGENLLLSIQFIGKEIPAFSYLQVRLLLVFAKLKSLTNGPH